MKPVTVPFFIPHAGCPHDCSFCNQRTVTGAAGIPDAAEILRKIDAWRSTAGVRPLEVAFFGGSFTMLSLELQERLLLPLQPLVEKGTISGIRLSTRPDGISASGASWLKQLGVRTVELGVQSMDPEVLRLSGRGHTAADVVTAFRLLHDAGLAPAGQLMPGLPGDTPQRTLASLGEVLDLRPAFLRIYPAVVLEGTPLAEDFRAGGYHPLSLDEAIAWCKPLLLECLHRQVPVLRLGLQPTDLLESQVVAGPYHPALRQLVAGELWYDLLLELLDGIEEREVTVSVNPAIFSDAAGQHRRNLMRLREQGYHVRLRQDDALDVHTAVAAAGPVIRQGSILDNRK